MAYVRLFGGIGAEIRENVIQLMLEGKREESDANEFF
jgi:hypothetical protein